jgi:hypothetical protein
MNASESSVRRGRAEIEIAHFDRGGRLKSMERAIRDVTMRVDQDEQVVEIIEGEDNGNCSK